MINLVLAIVLMVSAFILIAMLPEMDDEKERLRNVRWVLWDVVFAVINLAAYLYNRGG